MTNHVFVEKAKNVLNHKTLYVMGCFGAPMNDKNKKRYTSNNPYNKAPDRVAMINAATADTFGFDCVCLVKGLLWGWNADVNKTYGGAVYLSNDTPDTTITNLIENYCTDVSTDFSHIEPGEFLVMEGHCGIYVGDGMCIESTPKWDNCVQLTEVWNIKKLSSKGRKWLKHGKLKMIDYVKSESVVRDVVVILDKDIDINTVNYIEENLRISGYNPIMCKVEVNV